MLEKLENAGKQVILLALVVSKSIHVAKHWSKREENIR
jgi:hypothetical protein